MVMIMNSFDLLGDVDLEDPSQVVEFFQQKMINSNKSAAPVVAEEEEHGSAARFPPSQAVQERRDGYSGPRDGGRGGAGRGRGGRVSGFGGRNSYTNENSDDEMFVKLGSGKDSGKRKLKKHVNASTKRFVYFDPKIHVYLDDGASYHDEIQVDTRFINPKHSVGREPQYPDMVVELKKKPGSSRSRGAQRAPGAEAGVDAYPAGYGYAAHGYAAQ